MIQKYSHFIESEEVKIGKVGCEFVKLIFVTLNKDTVVKKGALRDLGNIYSTGNNRRDTFLCATWH